MSRLTICFTSDLHGYLYNTNFVDALPRPVGLLGMAFPQDGQTLIIDGGDTLQGSPLTYFLHEKGHAAFVADALNARGYAYVTLGNHDFNYGPAYLASYIEALHARCLCANVQDLTGRIPLQPCCVHTMADGLRVGLFGIVTHWVNLWEKKENLQGLRITEPLEAARLAVEQLKSEGCDLIVGIYHGGLEKDPDTGRTLSDTDENEACRLCEELPIDLLLTGHQHIAMVGKNWHGTHVVQPPCNGRQYVRVDLDERGQFTSALVSPCETPELTEQETQVREQLDAWLSEPIGQLSRALTVEDRLSMALHGSGIADLINLVQLEASGADISVTAIPNECRGFSEQVTVQDVVASYPYANTLCVLRATGRQVREALEVCATYFDVRDGEPIRIAESFLQPKEAHYNYDFFMGVEYAFDLLRPAGQRVVRLERGGRALEDEDEVTVCMNDYRATGAGDFPMWKACPHVREIQTEVSELILRYVQAHGRIDLPNASFPVCFSGDERL